MHALILQGNGKFYVSCVFGYYTNITATDEYKRYIEGIHNPYWIVWDPDGKKLIKWLAMVPNTRLIIPQILIVDADQSNWIVDDSGVGCVDYLSKELIDHVTCSESQPEDILRKCRENDIGYVYEEYREIKNQIDIENFVWATGGFHDARIEKQTLQNDGTLYLHFIGVWGCAVDVWFWEDLEYDTSSRDPEEDDPCWSDSTVLLQNGFMYFVDEEDMTVDQIERGHHCYFKARHMKYRIIPN